jgi:hypothetical protein
MIRLLLLLALLMLNIALAAQDTLRRKSAMAVRTNTAPRIDGKLEEDVWKIAPVIGGFIQNSPTENAPVSQPTEVWIAYDNTALYIGAFMHDPSPDSIMQQLGVRDGYLAADQFRIVFDTYNTQQDAFDFSVYASGVQSDSRFSDFNYNAVWNSEVAILPTGWSVEIAIPWSALRFPTDTNQIWGLQITRNFQRKQEFDQWALTPKDKPNPMQYWGTLAGLNNIISPLRLSMTPYATGIWQKDEAFGDGVPAVSGTFGADLKYGINESFTLDMTLLPDFSQVQSDNVVKNLGAFEVMFNEQRPFFTEGTDLFSLGDLLYSRRIGKRPTRYFSAQYQLDSNERLVSNPSRARLINASKISGRTNEGLGIGILNAYLDNTYAVIEDTITGKRRNFLTEPRSNYNIVVAQKQLKNSSSAYLINTNVIRNQGYNSANVTGAGFRLNNKKNTWRVSGDGALSNILSPIDSLDGQFNSTMGYKYSVRLAKTSGKWQYSFDRRVFSKNYNANDLGITFQTNFASQSANLSYYIFNPVRRTLFANYSIGTNYQYNIETGERNALSMYLNMYIQFKNFSSMFFGADWSPLDQRDYYEPRVDGHYFNVYSNVGCYGGWNSNSNNPFSYGFNIYTGTTLRGTETIPLNPWIGGGLNFNWRAGDRFKISFYPYSHNDFGDRGWVNIDAYDNIVFGRRIIRNLENSLEMSYVFKRDMSISLISRHYWSSAHYTSFYSLDEFGELVDYPTYTGYHDFSFNFFSVDVVYQWIFAPGSTLSIAWKQNIQAEDAIIDYHYGHNLNSTFRSPQFNQVSVRVLYFLDYIYVKRALSRKH